LDRLRAGAAAVTDWWRQRKPFRTTGGESHEMYFAGDERDPRPMVSSHDPRPVAYRLDEFQRMAQETSATDAQRAAVPIISATRTALAGNPNDATIVTNLRTLFSLFDDPVRPIVASYRPRPGRISGDPTGTTVGIGMRIDGLNQAWVRSHPGTPPATSTQRDLMRLLDTDPSNSSALKYVKGHILNENIGGIAENQNLFPITGNANSRHYYSTERRVVNWIAQRPANWAIYEVDVVNVNADLARWRPVQQNKVNATLQCRAVLKKPDGTDQESVLSTISSTYTVRSEAAEAFEVR
jgi:hypothetical protein